MVIVACFALNIFHPAFTFREAMEGMGGLGSKKKMRKLEAEREKAAADETTQERSGSNSDDADVVFKFAAV